MWHDSHPGVYIGKTEGSVYDNIMGFDHYTNRIAAKRGVRVECVMIAYNADGAAFHCWKC